MILIRDVTVKFRPTIDSDDWRTLHYSLEIREFPEGWEEELKERAMRELSVSNKFRNEVELAEKDPNTLKRRDF